MLLGQKSGERCCEVPFLTILLGIIPRRLARCIAAHVACSGWTGQGADGMRGTPGIPSGFPHPAQVASGGL